MRKNVLILGSSGMIGKIILEECLISEEIEHITLINRKPSGIKNQKVMEIIHSNFSDFSILKDQLKNIAICYYCVGVYTGQVKTAEFKTITYDYTKAIADVLKEQNPALTFCFLSGAGADSSEKSAVLFAKEKGKAENYLLHLNFAGLFIFRPGYIYPVIKRQEPNFFYKVMRLLYKPLSFLYPNIGVSSVKLAHKMFEVGLHGSNQVIFENSDIRN